MTDHSQYDPEHPFRGAEVTDHAARHGHDALSLRLIFCECGVPVVACNTCGDILRSTMHTHDQWGGPRRADGSKMPTTPYRALALTHDSDEW